MVSALHSAGDQPERDPYGDTQRSSMRPVQFSLLPPFHAHGQALTSSSWRGWAPSFRRETRQSHYRNDPVKYDLDEASHGWPTWSFSLARLHGIARTQTPTNKNYALELLTFGTIAGVSPTVVQWTSLTLGEPPSWSWLTPVPGKYAQPTAQPVHNSPARRRFFGSKERHSRQPAEHIFLLGRLGLDGCFGRISRPSLALKKIGTVLKALARYTPLKEG